MSRDNYKSQGMWPRIINILTVKNPKPEEKLEFKELLEEDDFIATKVCSAYSCFASLKFPLLSLTPYIADKSHYLTL